MATTEENLRAFLLADADIKAAVKAVSYNHVPQDKDSPYIFFQQSGATDDTAMDDAAGTPTRPRYTFEIWADNPADAIALKNTVQGKLHRYRGSFGTDGTAKGIFAEDVSDNYIGNGNSGDDGMHGAFFDAEVVL